MAIVISKEVLNMAKQLYMAHKPVAEIARDLNINRTTLVHHTKKWKKEREVMDSGLIGDVPEQMVKEVLAGIANNTLVAVKRSIDSLATREVPPSTKEAVDLVKILESIQKIAEYYGDKNEDEVKEPLTREAMVALDPFLEK